MDDVFRETELDAAPEEVWGELISLGGWFSAETRGDVAPGEVVTFSWPDGSERRALIEHVDEPKRLSFRWLPGRSDEPSRVEITIDEVDGGSVVRVVERRIGSAVSPEPEIGFLPLARL